MSHGRLRASQQTVPQTFQHLRVRYAWLWLAGFVSLLRKGCPTQLGASLPWDRTPGTIPRRTTAGGCSMHWRGKHAAFYRRCCKSHGVGELVTNFESYLNVSCLPERWNLVATASTHRSSATLYGRLRARVRPLPPQRESPYLSGALLDDTCVSSQRRTSQMSPGPTLSSGTAGQAGPAQAITLGGKGANPQT